MKAAPYARYYPITSATLLSLINAVFAGRTLKRKAGISLMGASLLRPGIQALITDAFRGRFDIVLAEAKDGLYGDQEDIAGLSSDSKLRSHFLRLHFFTRPLVPAFTFLLEDPSRTRGRISGRLGDLSTGKG